MSRNVRQQSGHFGSSLFADLPDDDETLNAVLNDPQSYASMVAEPASGADVAGGVDVAENDGGGLSGMFETDARDVFNVVCCDAAVAHRDIPHGKAVYVQKMQQGTLEMSCDDNNLVPRGGCDVYVDGKCVKGSVFELSNEVRLKATDSTFEDCEFALGSLANGTTAFERCTLKGCTIIANNHALYLNACSLEGTKVAVDSSGAGSAGRVAMLSVESCYFAGRETLVKTCTPAAVIKLKGALHVSEDCSAAFFQIPLGALVYMAADFDPTTRFLRPGNLQVLPLDECNLPTRITPLRCMVVVSCPEAESVMQKTMPGQFVLLSTKQEYVAYALAGMRWALGFAESGAPMQMLLASCEKWLALPPWEISVQDGAVWWDEPGAERGWIPCYTVFRGSGTTLQVKNVRLCQFSAVSIPGVDTGNMAKVVLGGFQSLRFSACQFWVNNPGEQMVNVEDCAEVSFRNKSSLLAEIKVPVNIVKLGDKRTAAVLRRLADMAERGEVVFGNAPDFRCSVSADCQGLLDVVKGAVPESEVQRRPGGRWDAHLRSVAKRARGQA